MEIIAHRSLEAAHVRHGLFTRRGGVSEGVFESLNCGVGSGDALDAVAENRRRVAAQLGVAQDRLLTPYQTHSRRAVFVEQPWAWDKAPGADAMVTDRPGLALGVLTADCAPVLLADAEAGVIGVAHAGWRGALDGVLEAAVSAMVEAGAESARIAALIGPCIGRESYEVGPEFRARFLALEPGSGELFRPAERPGHSLFDLEGFVAQRLARLGLKEIAPLSLDTFADEDRFFSYRRTVRRGGEAYGRLVSAIVLAP